MKTPNIVITAEISVCMTQPPLLFRVKVARRPENAFRVPPRLIQIVQKGQIKYNYQTFFYLM